MHNYSFNDLNKMLSNFGARAILDAYGGSASNAHVSGDWYYCLNPSVMRSSIDEKIGSFRVNVLTGEFQEYKDKVSNASSTLKFVSLVSYLTGKKRNELAKEIQDFLTDYTQAVIQVRHPQYTGKEGRSVLDGEHELIQPDKFWLARRQVNTEKYGQPTYIYVYHSLNGKPDHYLLRYDLLGGGKRFAPQSLALFKSGPWSGKKRWIFEDRAENRLLYNAHLIKEAQRIVVVEGEKAADKAARMFPPHYACITSPYGAGSAHLTDWSPCTGKQVLIWPDNDLVGYESYALRVKEILEQIGCTVRILHVQSVFNMPAENPEYQGYDIVDIAEKLGYDTFKKIMQAITADGRCYEPGYKEPPVVRETVEFDENDFGDLGDAPAQTETSPAIRHFTDYVPDEPRLCLEDIEEDPFERFRKDDDEDYY